LLVLVDRCNDWYWIGLVAGAIVLGPAVGGFLGLGMGLASGGAGIIGGVAAGLIGGLGASLVLGGIAQLISPQQTYSSAERGKDAARFESFTFSGITNTVQQGLPVPIVYGRAYIGSSVISSGLDVDQLV
jgi:predicted phage tail protein